LDALDAGEEEGDGGGEGRGGAEGGGAEGNSVEGGGEDTA